MKFLQENLLDHLRRPEFAELYESLEKRRCAKGAFICSPVTAENRVFIVAEGRARAYLGYEDKEFSLGILSKGDIYTTHTRAFVQALDDMEILTADVMTFRSRMLDDPEVGKAMVGVLGGMLNASFQIIEGLAFKDVNSRLATLLVSEAKNHGAQDVNGDIMIQVDLSVEQIAGLLGSTRQTVSTLLNALTRNGLVRKLDRGRFLICDLDGLEALAEPAV